MATVLERLPIDDITDEARQVRLGRVFLTLIAAVFFGAGWVAGKVAFAVVWCGLAVRAGWREARRPTAGRSG